VKLFEDSGGAGKLKVAGGKVCYGEDETMSTKLAHEVWPNASLPGELAQELPSPKHFEQACSLVTEDKIAESIPTGNDPDRSYSPSRSTKQQATTSCSCNRSATIRLASSTSSATESNLACDDDNGRRSADNRGRAELPAAAG